ncbi:MAG TPA: hypothetical protein VE779_07510, partial [Candidatus Angelobacter sp.]|nr:hypothetical protein [Candidatus Angelobacter sp.]
SKLGLPKELDFRNFRTMHASLMRRTGARAEITRDNMGHSEIPTTLEIYSKTWWDERADAVSAVVGMVMNSDGKADGESAGEKEEGPPPMLFPTCVESKQLAPQLAPQPNSGAVAGLEVVEKIGRGERI